MNLNTDPCVSILTTGGPDVRGLRGCFDDDVIAIAEQDELEKVAILCLLLAIWIASERDGISPRVWLDRHTENFELFHPTAPFGQNPDMARFADIPKATRPLTNASYRDSGHWSIAVNPRHDASETVYSHPAAARLLLVRLLFSVGGVQPFPEKCYGVAPTSAKNPVGIGRPLVWFDTGRLNTSLKLTAAMTADRPAGTFHFTWPDGASPADYGSPTGILDGLTWRGRSILLTDVTADSVGSVMICDGIRLPESVDRSRGAYDPELEWQLIPYTIYSRKTDKDPYTPQGVHAARSAWRQLAKWCVDESNPAAHWHKIAAGHGGRWRLSGLSSLSAAVHGPVSGSFPEPVDPGDLRVFLGALDNTYGAVSSAGGSLNKATTSFDGFRGAIPTHTALDAIAEPLARDLATGEITLTEALSCLGDAKRHLIDTAVRSVGRVRPGVAGHVSARLANNAAAARKNVGSAPSGTSS